MSAPRKNTRTDGCWTCKLRRKKCDELRPTCANCSSLEIACNYGRKPAWFDGGAQQRQMSESLKDEIKRKAAFRREKANTISNVAHDATAHQFNVLSDMMASNDLSSNEPTDTAMSGDEALAGRSTSTALHGPTPFTLLSNEHDQHRCLNDVNQSPANETDFIMKYLDFVFPALFPFYRPAVFETGRSWLLLLLGKSKIAYHSTVSLSCYLFTMVLTDAATGDEHTDCKHLRWEEVEQQTNMCFESIRADMLALDLNSEATKLEKVEFLESIIQVLIFEIALGKSAPWNSHLPPAYALFEQIMVRSDPSNQNQSQSKFVSVLMEIGPPLWTMTGQPGHIWASEQAGFRFCAGLLIFIDVVASTAIQQTPRLLQYHSDILDPIDEGTSIAIDAEIRLSSIVGCRNWVIRSIAEISVLESQNRGQVETGNYSVVELNDRASEIASVLRSGILEIQNGTNTDSRSSLTYRAPFDVGPDPSASATSTLIWAYAAQLYLTVVVSGWQIGNIDVGANVAQIIQLLQTVPSYQLRALAWPLCVAGCLALESEEPSFRTLLSNQGKAYTAGALDDTRQILERVWQVRTTLDASTWNLASCFSILGSPVLLV